MKKNETIQENSRLFKDSHKKCYVIIASIIAIVQVYYLLKILFHFDLIYFLYNLFMLKYLPALGNDVSYGLLFVIGVLTSFHCIGMCGGIAMSQTIRKKDDKNSDGKHAGEWLLLSAFYNTGRVLSYTIAGGVAGGLGQVLSFNGAFKGIIPILGGVFMIIMGIKLLGIFPVLRKFNIPVPSFAAKKIIGSNNYAPFIVGMLTGLMPCGPLQIVQLYAMGTKSIAVGALSMFVFSVGTLPALFALGALNSYINKKNSDKILKLSAVFVVVLGLVMMGRGLALSGINLNFLHKVEYSYEGIAKIEGNIQTVTTNLEAGSYSPITVQKGIPLRWTIMAEKENLNECNNAIIIPKLNISGKLSEGENVIEFTPYEEGQIIYSCWMGMIKSSITVVSDLSAISPGKTSNNQTVCKMENTESCMEYSIAENKAYDKKEYIAIHEEAAKPDDEIEGRKEVQNNTDSSLNKSVLTEAEPRIWEGYLTDKHCFGLMKPEKETRACLLMEECEASGYGIAVKQKDESYELLLFDQKGHKLAYELLNKAEKNTGFKINVRGTLKENRINVSELSAD